MVWIQNMSGSCSMRRPRRRNYLQNAAEDGGLSLRSDNLCVHMMYVVVRATVKGL